MAEKLVYMGASEIVDKLLNGERDFSSITNVHEYSHEPEDLTEIDNYEELRDYLEKERSDGRLGENNELRINCSRICIKTGNIVLPLYAKEANLKGSDFSETDLSYSVFGGADISNVIFDGANLYQGRIVHSDARNASFRNANLDGVDIDASSKLVGAFMIGASIKDARINRADLRSVNFYGADLTFTRISADLRHAVLESADLYRTDFSSPVKEGSGFGESVSGADLRGVHGLDSSKYLNHAIFFKTRVTEREKRIIEKALKDKETFLLADSPETSFGEETG